MIWQVACTWENRATYSRCTEPRWTGVMILCLLLNLVGFVFRLHADYGGETRGVDS